MSAKTAGGGPAGPASADTGQRAAEGPLGLAQQAPADRCSSCTTQLTGYYAPKNFNIWYFFGSLALVVLVLQLVTGIFLTMFYKPGELTSFDSVEFIMREVDLRLAHPLPAFHRRLGVLHRRLPAHVPRAALRLVQGAARAAVAPRHAGVPRAHGRGVHGLRAALGQHVVLGRAGDRQPVRHDSRDRPGAGAVDPRRLRHRGCDAQPLLRAARRGGAARAAAAGGAAPGGAARNRLEQPGRHRDQGQARRATASRSTASRSIPITPSRTSSASVCSSCCSRSSCSSCRRSAACSSRRRTSSLPIPCPRPRTSRRCGTSRPYYAILRAVPDQGLGRAADVSGGGGVPVPAVARPLAGEVDALPRAGCRARRWRCSSCRSSCSGTSACSQPQGLYVVLARIFAARVFRVFHADAVLYPLRSGEARA